MPVAGRHMGSVQANWTLVMHREIHRRRNDLLVEMFYLMKRKEDLSSMGALDEDKAELSEFMNNMDIMKQCVVFACGSLLILTINSRPEVSHVASLLHIPDDHYTPEQAGPEQAQAADDSPHVSSPESSSSEPPASPSTQEVKLEEEASSPVHPHTSDEVMDVDVAEEFVSSTQDSAPEPVAGGDLLEKEEPQEPVEPSLPPPPSQIMDVEEVLTPQTREEARKSTPIVEIPGPERAPSVEIQQPPPTVVQHVEIPPATDAEGDATLGLRRAVSHAEAPLPIARIESQTKYLVSEAPSPAPPPPDFMFGAEMSSEEHIEDRKPAINPAQTLLKSPDYTLPPLKTLPMEYNRKGKPKPSKKRDRDRGDGKQEWQPLGLAKWNAILRANPIHKKISKASKCLNTKDWDVRASSLGSHIIHLLTERRRLPLRN